MKILSIDYGKKKIGLASSEGPSAGSASHSTLRDEPIRLSSRPKPSGLRSNSDTEQSRRGSDSKSSLQAGSGLSLVTGLGAIRVNSLKEAVKRVSEVIAKEEIEKVIIGLAESGESRKMVQRFVKEIKETKGVEVEMVDETLTTHRAQVQIREIGGGDEDERAAMLILENYLEGVE